MTSICKYRLTANLNIINFLSKDGQGHYLPGIHSTLKQRITDAYINGTYMGGGGGGEGEAWPDNFV